MSQARSGDCLAHSTILMIVLVGGSRSIVHAHHPVLTIVGISVGAIIRNIARSVIRVVHCDPAGHARDSIRRSASALLQRDCLNLISATHRIPYPASIAPPVISKPSLRARAVAGLIRRHQSSNVVISVARALGSRVDRSAD